ncbi:aromatic ring-opening dioxygenase LigA [Burkholderia multivorans]|nr:aromatic ring-opening dioxygenase LigA [Burkholderia multivorans]RAA25240.1 aromatic ring-opening dioxygenase LigA [Burkholderia multivorans]RAA27495.1 aromatic ring-opening dioxygenase LigA [Burkholderia multivorans]RAA42562.1 aromatic ring-opening dioxygenase LigA [Burkholderia multivorans]RAA46768.1 aromatic ring-opening dioxygenase LigA [Burkholderia multivorans]
MGRTRQAPHADARRACGARRCAAASAYRMALCGRRYGAAMLHRTACDEGGPGRF